jgi:hypothetical protein
VRKSTAGETAGVGLFSPREYKGGRVKVYGCSPGCLVVSIALSLFLTLALNGCIHLLS